MRSPFFSCYCTLLLLLLIQCSLQYVSAIDWFPSNDEADYLDPAAEPDLLHEPRLLFNATLNAYNATTIATVGGAVLFFALNSIFILTFLTPKARGSSRKKTAESTNEQQYEYYDEDDYSDFNYDEVVKRYVSVSRQILLLLNSSQP